MTVKRHAMIATSQPLAVGAALDVLKVGGNAVDAAVCAVAMLGVVEPMSTGIGGDCFAIVYEAKTGKLHGLNGSGRAPASASIQDVHAAGHCAMPQSGILPVTVPGALHAWQSLLDRFGSRTLSQLLQPAIQVAQDGFSVTPIIARDFAGQAGALARGTNTHAYLPGGRAPQAGEVFKQSELARGLQIIADQGISSFYEGALARALVLQSQRLGGWLSMDDLAEHTSTWVEPISTDYRGFTLHELPPNGQGVIVLEALNLLEGFQLAGMAEADRMHVQIEAVKLAFADAWRYVADPEVSDVPTAGLLSKEYARARRGFITEKALQRPTHGFPPSGTVYVTVVDGDGNAVSLINSLYEHFGAKVVVERTGILLQNRGELFSLDPGHPNALAPGKRPYHTIIPAMVCRDGKPWLCFGVVGGFMQPQAQVQLLCNLIDLKMDLQAAVDAPRFRWNEGAGVMLEQGFSKNVEEALLEKGHRLMPVAGHGGFGGAQAILIDPANGALSGASDSRKDGCVSSC